MAEDERVFCRYFWDICRVSNPAIQNILSELPDASRGEVVLTLLESAGVRLERVVSAGQCTPKGQWLEQDKEEWVLVLAGRGHLSFQGKEDFIALGAGDSVRIPAGTKHRVEWTDTKQKTVWLALHFGA